jgi:DNA-binding transcriptional regulator YiaG
MEDAMRRVMERYEETGLGLPYPVVLLGSAVEHLDAEGNVIGVSVPDLEGLAAAVALSRAFDPVALDGREVRFLRKLIGLPAKDFAEHIHINPATLSRWENNKETVGEWADGMVRFAVAAIIAQDHPELQVNLKELLALRTRPRRDGEPWPVFEFRHRPRPDNSPPAVSPMPEEQWVPDQLMAA